MGSSQTRDCTCVPCIGKWILNHWTTREVWLYVYLSTSTTTSFLMASLCMVHSFHIQFICNFGSEFCPWRASLVAQRLKRLPAILETQVWSLSGEDPLEKEISTQSSIFAWKVPWTEEPGGLQSRGSQTVGYDWATNTLHAMVSWTWLQSENILVKWKL